MTYEKRLQDIRKKVKPEIKWVTVYNKCDDLSKFFYLDPDAGEVSIDLDEARARWGDREDYSLIVLKFVETGTYARGDVYE